MDDRWPTWSPGDGEQIAYSAGGNLSLLDPGLESPQQVPQELLHRPETDEMPAWSPDGERIVFTTRGQGIRVYELATGLVTPQTPGPLDTMPAWGPNGDHITFVRDGVNGPRIWTMTAAGAQLQEVPGQVSNNEDPDWK